MSRPLEKTFQRRVLAALAKLPNCFYYKAQAVSIGGIPDVVACIAGVAVFLELKRDETSCLSPLQAYTLEKIRKAGGYAVKVSPENWNDVFTVLKKLSEETNSVQDLLSRIAG